MPRRSVEQKGRNKLRKTIWRVLIRFGNTGRGFKVLLRLCLKWIGGLPGDEELCADVANGWEIEELAVKYRCAIQQLLTWMVIRDDETVARIGFQLLNEHETMTWRSECPKYDRNLLRAKVPREMMSVMTPICQFIGDQTDIHDEDGSPVHKAFPVALCKLMGCGGFKLVLAIRKTGVFCSDECKAEWGEFMRSKERKKAYMKDYRDKDRYGPPTRRRQLK